MRRYLMISDQRYWNPVLGNITSGKIARPSVKEVQIDIQMGV